MNTRNLYHSLLWLSAACIAVLGFFLIQSQGKIKEMESARQLDTQRTFVLQSNTGYTYAIDQSVAPQAAGYTYALDVAVQTPQKSPEVMTKIKNEVVIVHTNRNR